MNTPAFKFCPSCGFELPANARFCPGCGDRITAEGGPSSSASRPSAISLTPKRAAIIGLISVLVWVPAWYFTQWSAGPRPSKDAAALQRENEKEVLDPAMKQLKEAADGQPENLELQREYASALIATLQGQDRPSNGVVFEAIEVLGRILKKDAKDATALIALADLSFNQQVFDKATSYFTRYLEIEPEDHDARARFASALSFQQRFDEAEQQLNQVLAKDPKNFHASAYLAITYAQKGDRERSVKAGQQALALAPNDEARARFTQFLDAVKQTSSETSASPSTISRSSSRTETSAVTSANSSTQRSSGDSPAGAANVIATVTETIRNNQIAGPKFVDAALDGSVLRLTFRNFPMEGMPPFVREKFVNTIKLKASDAGLSEILFIDAETLSTMHSTSFK